MSSMSAMPSSDTKELTRKRVRALCLALLPPRAAEALAVQIERVLFRVTSDEQREELRDPPDVVAAFHAKGLIPPRLLDLARTIEPEPEARPADEVTLAERNALAFAASVFPQRAFQLPETALGLRVGTFLAGRAPTQQQDVSFEKDRLFADLSAAESVPETVTGTEARERLIGAHLYLATCHEELIRRTLASWREDAGFLRYLRKCLPTSPSSLTRQDRLIWPSWANVAKELGRIFPGEPAAHHELAVIVEQMAFKEARRWLAPAVVPQGVRDFWEVLWDKLTSGFPYYAFASRFTWWWKVCLKHHRFSARDVPLDERRDTRVAVTTPGTALELAPEELRLFREGYRLVRVTFFGRADKSSRENVAARNDRLRQALDALWYRRLESRMGEDVPRELVRDIASRFPDLTEDTINNLSFRLRIRMGAYGLARLKRLRNAEIRSARRPRDMARRGATETPFLNQPGVATVATLARSVPAKTTLLWAFTAHVFLHPLIEPQRPDDWTFKRYLRELWHWVTDDAFEDALRRGADAGGRADGRALSALSTEPFQSLMRELRKQETEDALERYLESRDFDDERRAALSLLRGLVGPEGIETAGREFLKAWRGLIESHWIVPVWYLKVMERLDDAALVSRLRVDDHEMDSVVALARAIEAVLSKGRTS